MSHQLIVSTSVTKMLFRLALTTDNLIDSKQIMNLTITSKSTVNKYVIMLLVEYDLYCMVVFCNVTIICIIFSSAYSPY